MIGLDELIILLQAERDKAGRDMPVRMVRKVGNEGHQYTVVGLEVADITPAEKGENGEFVLKKGEQYMMLILEGEQVASMDWPLLPPEEN